MKKYLKPWTIWAAFIVISITILVKKYQYNPSDFFKFSTVYVFIILIFLLCSIYTYIFDRGKLQGPPIASFAFGLTFWIPLLNLVFGILGIYLGVKALIKIRKEPNKYGGKSFAVLGIILSTVVYVTYLTGVGMCLLSYREICKNIGLSILT